MCSPAPPRVSVCPCGSGSVLPRGHYKGNCLSFNGQQVLPSLCSAAALFVHWGLSLTVFISSLSPFLNVPENVRLICAHLSESAVSRPNSQTLLPLPPSSPSSLSQLLLPPSSLLLPPSSPSLSFFSLLLPFQWIFAPTSHRRRLSERNIWPGRNREPDMCGGGMVSGIRGLCQSKLAVLEWPKHREC